MKKRALTFVATILLTAGTAFAQGIFPTVYSTMLGDNAFPWTLTHIWDETVRGECGQGLGLVTPGAKKIVTTIKRGEDWGGPVTWEFELYPNGLMKCDNAQNGKHTYNYDNQWRLQNVAWGDKIAYKYVYNQKNQLIQCIASVGVSDEFTFTYGPDGKLSKIVKVGSERYSYKNDQLVKTEFISEYATQLPITYSYDPQGRWKGYTSIVEDGMDEVFTFKTQVTYNYTGTNPFPTSVTKSVVEYDPKRKRNIGKPQVTTYRCTYTFDSKGNWTSWKATGGYGAWEITRTITYYTDEEVKAATAELEQARKGTTQDNGQRKEDLWEF